MGSQGKEILKLIEQKAGGERQTIVDTLAAGYAGIRLGTSMTQDVPLLAESQMVGILAEVRAGPLNGLRWNWDFGPEVKKIDNGYEQAFTWSRATLGWSFGFPFQSFISKLDVVPKIGVMSLDGTVGLRSALSKDVVDVARFRQRDVLNVGIETGVEMELPWFLMRFWGASDISGFVNIDEDAKVSSIRGGLDVYFKLLRLFDHYHLTLLTFASMDQVTMEKMSVGDDPAVGTSGSKLAGITYQIVYAGLGLAVRW